MYSNTEHRVCTYTEHRIQGVYRTQNTDCIQNTECIKNTEYRVRIQNTDCIQNTENRDYTEQGEYWVYTEHRLQGV